MKESVEEYWDRLPLRKRAKYFGELEPKQWHMEFHRLGEEGKRLVTEHIERLLK